MRSITPIPDRIDGFYSKPNPDKTSEVDTVWFRDDGSPLCSALRRRCRKCKHFYPAEERILARCPECEEWRFCQSVVRDEGGRCRMHGGTSLRGASHPNFETGRYSKHMPTRLQARYLEAASDPELLNVRHEIAVLDTRISDLLSRVDAGDSGRLFARAREAFIGFRNALDREDSETMRIHLQTLDGVLAKGHGDFAAWQDVRDSIDSRRKLVETEITRLTKMGQIVTAEDIQTLIHAVAGLAKRIIKDQAILNEFIAALLEIGTPRPR